MYHTWILWDICVFLNSYEWVKIHPDYLTNTCLSWYETGGIWSNAFKQSGSFIFVTVDGIRNHSVHPVEVGSWHLIIYSVLYISGGAGWWFSFRLLLSFSGPFFPAGSGCLRWRMESSWEAQGQSGLQPGPQSRMVGCCKLFVVQT